MIGLMRDELARKIMIRMAWSIPKINWYLTNDRIRNRNGKGTKSCVAKQEIKFKGCTNFQEANQLENKIKILEQKQCWCR